MLKKFFSTILFPLILGWVVSLAEVKEDWTKTSFGSFNIERFWEETHGEYTCTYTLVSYKNTTEKTFEEKVTIRATIYDSQENMIDTNTRSFFAHEYGPIEPGFEGTVKIPIPCKEGQAKFVKVGIDSAS